MRLSKTKKYLYYFLVFMPFMAMGFQLVFYSFTNQLLELQYFNIVDDCLQSFMQLCDGFVPKFGDFGDIVYNLFYTDGIWGECLVSYFIYFIAITLYSVLVDLLLFFVYIFESWVNKIESKM